MFVLRLLHGPPHLREYGDVGRRGSLTPHRRHADRRDRFSGGGNNFRIDQLVLFSKGDESVEVVYLGGWTNVGTTCGSGWGF